MMLKHTYFVSYHKYTSKGVLCAYGNFILVFKSFFKPNHQKIIDDANKRALEYYTNGESVHLISVNRL